MVPRSSRSHLNITSVPAASSGTSDTLLSSPSARSQATGTSLSAQKKASKNGTSKNGGSKRGKTLKWAEADMTAAINHINSTPGTSVRRASTMFNVPRTTLRDRLSGRVAVGAKLGCKPQLSGVLEQKLIDYATS